MQLYRRVMFVCASAALGACGLAGGGVTQVVAKDRSEVYDAFETAFAGVEHKDRRETNGRIEEIEIRVEREPGRSLDATALIDGAVIGNVRLDFSDAEGGAHTLVRGTAAVDNAMMAKAAREDRPMYLPQAAVDVGLSQALASAARRIENGLPLGYGGSPATAMSTVMGMAGSRAQLEVRQAEAAVQQRAATAPVASAEPMIDPNESARAYLNQ